MATRLPLGSRLSRRQALLRLAGGALTWGSLGALACSRFEADASQLQASPAPTSGHQVTPEAGMQRSSTDRVPVRVFYSSDYVLAGHSFETTRKSGWIADSLARDPIANLELGAPSPLSEADVCQVHDPEYVTAVRTGEPRAVAESQGFRWDAGLWPMVLASNGGAVAAALTALRDGVAGSLSSGLHHAYRDRGKGFCTINGLAIAARAALAAGATMVLVLDLDAHCGGGTHSLLGSDPTVHHVDVSVNSFDRYEPAGSNTLDRVSAAADYLPTVRARLDELADHAGSFSLCLYNAGMDPHQDCPIGGFQGITRAILEERERLVFEWARHHRVPIAFVLAGGYIGPDLDADRLVDLHRLTLSAATSI